ncbi:hypothetical protein NDU88_008565 [Pleurodeles waltl]|uniref:Uncharacterized protein n=1 Tax=Pleurodeles waltl TaxID=8319 RepID=A0AAV7RY16_PLEWA|nr:hypothetical protein NDU88_008565 [Pleurodeles waltl]
MLYITHETQEQNVDGGRQLVADVRRRVTERTDDGAAVLIKIMNSASLSESFSTRKLATSCLDCRTKPTYSINRCVCLRLLFLSWVPQRRMNGR